MQGTLVDVRQGRVFTTIFIALVVDGAIENP
jgi:hypothetical protein